MALNSLLCADVPLRNCSINQSMTLLVGLLVWIIAVKIEVVFEVCCLFLLACDLDENASNLFVLFAMALHDWFFGLDAQLTGRRAKT